jgi:hypothetical protein
MIVTVLLVRVVQPSVDQVILMISVGDTLMPAIRPVHVGAAGLFRGAPLRIGIAGAETVVVYVVAVVVMQVAIVQIVGVPVVFD